MLKTTTKPLVPLFTPRTLLGLLLLGKFGVLEIDLFSLVEKLMFFKIFTLLSKTPSMFVWPDATMISKCGRIVVMTLNKP